MTKKVSFGGRPSTARPPAPNPDAWVAERGLAGKETMKRLTLDIPESLHRSIKTDCARRGTKIADELRALLSEKYGEA